jgi:hypothetical protein
MGAAQPLQGSGGRRDSLGREREEVVVVLTNGVTWRQSCGNDHTTEVVGGAPISMGRWFRARGGEIGAEVGAVDNGGALVAPFIRL